MAPKLFHQKTRDTKYNARYVQSFIINLPAEKVNLYKWVTGMTDSDYAMYSPAHKAMGSFFKNDTFYMINVENIGLETVIQRYELNYHSPNHVQFYSAKSIAYMMRWFPVTVGVPWELYVQPVTANSCRLICLIGVDFPNLFLKIGGWLSSFGGMFLTKHLKKEGKAFARDIETKFKRSLMSKII
ncbi:MAG: hypothetical protein QM734_02910 [Cyclobacteriaceae bacterium]